MPNAKRGPGRPALKIKGKRFGRLRALKPVGSGPNGVVWRCLCDCGNVRDVPAGFLSSGSPHECHECAAGRDYSSQGRSKRHAELRQEALDRAELLYHDFVFERMSYPLLAEKYHVTKQRVGQIIRWYEEQQRRVHP